MGAGKSLNGREKNWTKKSQGQGYVFHLQRLQGKDVLQGDVLNTNLRIGQNFSWTPISSNSVISN